MVEFALVIPIFIALIFGIVEGARLIYTYNTINHASQEAARMASLQDTSDEGAVVDKALDAADPLTLSTGDVSVDVNDGGTGFGDRAIGDRVTVKVDYHFVPLVSFVFGSNAGIDLVGESEVMVE